MVAESRPEWDACRKPDVEPNASVGVYSDESEYVWTARVPMRKEYLEGVDIELLNRRLCDLLTRSIDGLIEECRIKPN